MVRITSYTTSLCRHAIADFKEWRITTKGALRDLIRCDPQLAIVTKNIAPRNTPAYRWDIGVKRQSVCGGEIIDSVSVESCTYGSDGKDGEARLRRELD